MGQYYKLNRNTANIESSDEVKEELINRLTECLGYLEATNASEYFLRQVNKTLALAKGYPISDEGSGAV